MPYIFFNNIENPESYKFDDGSYETYCKKELCWVEDESWDDIKNFCLRETFEELGDTGKRYLALRIENSEIVEINDDIQHYLNNDTIKFLIELYETETHSAFLHATDDDIEKLRQGAEMFATLFGTDKQQYLMLLKISVIGERLSDHMKSVMDKIQEARFLRMSDSFSMSWNIISCCEIVENAKILAQKAKHHGIDFPYDFVPTKAELMMFENELTMMKEYLNNIALTINKKKEENRHKTLTEIDHLNEQISLIDKKEKETTDRAQQTRQKITALTRKLTGLTQEENPSKTPEELQIEKASLDTQIRGMKQEMLSALTNTRVGSVDTISLKSKLRTLQRELDDDSGFCRNTELSKLIDERIKSFYEAFNLVGLDKYSSFSKSKIDPEDNEDADTDHATHSLLHDHDEEDDVDCT